MSVESFRNYLELEKQVSKHTLKAYMGDLNSFIIFCSEQMQLSSIEKIPYSIIRNWIVHLVDSKISNRSINRKLVSLKAYYKFLLKVKVINELPFFKHQPLKVLKKKQLPFSLKEMNLCLRESEFEDDFQGIRDRLIIELFYATGMRRSELINLKDECVDLNEGVLKVFGKGNKERFIPITPRCIDLIKAYRVLRKDLASDVYLFMSKAGKQLTDSFVYKMVKDRFKEVSTKLKISPHILRHTAATHILNNGANINDIKVLLGHSSLVATQIYTDNSILELKKQYKKAHPRTNN